MMYQLGTHANFTCTQFLDTNQCISTLTATARLAEYSQQQDTMEMGICFFPFKKSCFPEHATFCATDVHHSCVFVSMHNISVPCILITSQRAHSLPNLFCLP